MGHIMLVNAVHKEQMRMATVDDQGKLIEFNIQMTVREPITGNIYKGKVLKVERGLQAAFVDYGGVKDGFLPLRDVGDEYFTGLENATCAGKNGLKPGQEIIVQVVREVTGNKGALLTSYLSLPGRYLVLLPNKLCGGISRKIDSEEERKKIKSLMEQIQVPDDMGFIVRTAGINRTKPEIQRDYQFLMRLWREIHKKAGTVKAPYFLYQETDFGVRTLRDYLTLDVEEILVDDQDAYRKMRAYLKAVAPRHLKILKQYKEKAPIFERFDLEDQIRVIYQERVELKSGGYIIINPTEAMITIDVNSGRGSNKKNIEETAYKTNTEACEEIARQLRLRDLGGLIVIDFIDMMDKKHNAEVEKAFKRALSVDRARIQLSRISKFGLLELSRQKKQSTIQEISYITCPHCKGSGLRPSLEYASLTAFRKIESEAVKGLYGELRVALPHEIAFYILNHKRVEFANLESSCGIKLYVEGRPDMAWDKLEIQQSLKDQHPGSDIILSPAPLLKLAEKTLPDATHLPPMPLIPDAEEETETEPDTEENQNGEATAAVVAEEAPHKKRRRPRHRRRKSAESRNQAPTSEEQAQDEPKDAIATVTAMTIPDDSRDSQSRSFRIESSSTQPDTLPPGNLFEPLPEDPTNNEDDVF